MTTVEIYGKEDCRFCKEAIALCDNHTLRFVYRDIADPQTRSEMFARNPAARTVPQIFIGTTHIGGFTELAALPISVLQQMIGE